MEGVVSDAPLGFSPIAPPGGRGPSKGSLALILPTSWAPSYKAADDLSHANFGQPGRPSMSDSADNQRVVINITCQVL